MFSLDYDVNLFYQAFSSLMESLWPIIAPAFGIFLAGLVMAAIVKGLRKWNEKT